MNPQDPSNNPNQQSTVYNDLNSSTSGSENTNTQGFTSASEPSLDQGAQPDFSGNPLFVQQSSSSVPAPQSYSQPQAPIYPTAQPSSQALQDQTQSSRSFFNSEDVGASTISSNALPLGGSQKPPFSKLPLMKIIIFLAAVVVLGVVAFLVNTFILPNKPGNSGNEQIELTYWGLQEDPQTMSGVITEYERLKPNVKIKYLQQSKQDYRERLVNSLARGIGPDVFRFHNTWVPMLGSYLDTLPPEIIDIQTYQGIFYPVVAQDLRKGADIVGIPLMFDGLALYINEDVFNAAGKIPPSDWNELRKLAAELTLKNEEGQILQSGVALGRTENVDHWQDIIALMMMQNGADLSNPVGKLAEDSLAFFALFSTRDEIWDESLPPSTQAFAQGKLAMYFAPSWRASEIKTLNPNLSFRVVPMPQLPKNTPSDPTVNWASYWAEGVWAKSKNQKEGWEFLKFLSSKESLEKMYQASSISKFWGTPYPRQDMAGFQEQDIVVGAYVQEAPTSKSWYLTSDTFDGPTGINTKISNLFKKAIDTVVNEGQAPEEAMQEIAGEIKQVLSSYNK